MPSHVSSAHSRPSTSTEIVLGPREQFDGAANNNGAVGGLQAVVLSRLTKLLGGGDGTTPLVCAFMIHREPPLEHRRQFVQEIEELVAATAEELT